MQDRPLVERVRLRQNIYADDLSFEDEQGNNVLHLVALYGHGRAVSLLVQRKPDLHRPNNKGLFPIHIAAQQGCITVLNALIKSGVKVNQPAADKYGYPPIIHAVLEGQLHAVKVLIENHQADEKACSKNGDSLLHAAAGSGHLSLVQYFVQQRHANVNSLNSKKQTPMHIAACYGKTQVIIWLQKNGGLRNQQDVNSQIPLQLAMKHRKVDCVVALYQSNIEAFSEFYHFIHDIVNYNVNKMMRCMLAHDQNPEVLLNSLQTLLNSLEDYQLDPEQKMLADAKQYIQLHNQRPLFGVIDAVKQESAVTAMIPLRQVEKDLLSFIPLKKPSKEKKLTYFPFKALPKPCKKYVLTFFCPEELIKHPGTTYELMKQNGVCSRAMLWQTILEPVKEDKPAQNKKLRPTAH